MLLKEAKISGLDGWLLLPSGEGVLPLPSVSLPEEEKIFFFFFQAGSVTL